MIDVKSLVEALLRPEMELYYHGDMRKDAAELLGGERSIEQWKDTCEEMATYYCDEDFLSEPRELVFDLLQKGKRKDELIEGLKRLSIMLEDIEYQEFNAGDTGRVVLRNMLKTVE